MKKRKARMKLCSSSDDVLGIRKKKKMEIMRKIKIGALTCAITLTPLILFGCADKR